MNRVIFEDFFLHRVARLYISFSLARQREWLDLSKPHDSVQYLVSLGSSHKA
jgi:hypothetical protein